MSEVHAKWPQLNNQHNNYNLLTMCCESVRVYACVYSCIYECICAYINLISLTMLAASCDAAIDLFAMEPALQFL